MKKYTKYSKRFGLAGEWHIHTNFSDGNHTVFEICKKASDIKLPLIAFTEHVRKNLSYDFNGYLKEINTARAAFPKINILIGCEAKVLPEGDLDCETEILKVCDYVLFAFHSFPSDKDLYYRSLIRALKNEFVSAWAHPGLFFMKNSNLYLSDDEIKNVFIYMNKYNVALEINNKYALPTKKWLNIYHSLGYNNVIRGSDIHNIDDLICG